MNTTSRNFKYLVFLIFIILGSAGCSQNKGQNRNEISAEDARKQELAQVPQQKLDSTYIISFIKEVPEFKKHQGLIRLFYRDRDYRLAWFRDNELVPQARNFVEVINRADKEGLNPENYKIRDFNKMFTDYEAAEISDSSKWEMQRELDVTLTGAYFHYASDFYRGTVNPREKSSIDWSVKRNKIKLNKALETILKERESTYPYYQFEALHAGYKNLRTALQHYRDIEKKGGWPKVEGVDKLKPGDSTAAVVSLRKRLLPDQKINPQDARAHVYDEELVQAVKEFQERHGLKPDGVIGAQTLKEMNVPVDDRIDQIIINMERWRWIPKRMVPKKLPDRYLVVNIPEYKLRVYEEGKEVLNMRVIVGKVLNNTRVFSDKLEYIVFSPYWNITKNILFDEVVPAQLRNPNFMYREQMEVVKDISRTKVQTVPISSIDWSSVTPENFQYRVRQRPGKRNPLGHVKFIFPNEYDIYLHDTPADHLFNQAHRGFSHGCIRIEKPVEMAEYLLKDQPQWTREKIEKAMHAGEEKYVNLKAKVPVYIVYFTAWADEKGNAFFRNDVYGHDKELEKELFQ